MATDLASLSVVDPTIRAELEMVGGADLLNRLVDMFFDDSANLVRTIDSARASGDATSVAKAAHRLKGGAAAVGAQRVAAVAKDIELAAKSGQVGGLDGARASLDSEMTALRSAMAG